ncbi:MAG: hypothetical protein K6G48_01270 [Acholeplasmatales bacterium]|nr:hypothetical protein [Acholeplasmatales bacterium]
MRSNKHRKVKTRFKFTKALAILLAFIAVIAIFTGVLSIESDAEKLYTKITTAQAAVEDFSGSTLDEDNVFKEISYKKLTTKVKSSDYVYVFYGTTTNTDYLTYIQTVNDRAQTYNVDRVYLLDSVWATSIDTDDEDYGEENNLVLSEVERALGGVDMTIVPSLWVFQNGEVVFNSDDYINDTYQAATWNYVIEQAFGRYPGEED